jgi:hypothetical protein
MSGRWLSRSPSSAPGSAAHAPSGGQRSAEAEMRSPELEARTAELCNRQHGLQIDPGTWVTGAEGVEGS